MVCCNFFRTSQFIIGLNKYIEAVNNGFTVGMRFKMRFEGEDSPERRYNRKTDLLFKPQIFKSLNLDANRFVFLHLIRFTGTIVGVEDMSPQWECSKWRSLKVNINICLILFRSAITIRTL